MRTRLIAATATACLSGTAIGQVWFTGLPEGATQSVVNDLSQDGSIAVGWTWGSAVGGHGFRWTLSGGRVDLEHNVVGMSSDGSVIAGQYAPGSSDRAYRRVGDGPIQDLGVLPGETRMFAYGISGDGSVVVGHGEHGPRHNHTGQAFRWTEQGGLEGLGAVHADWIYSEALAVSRDGGTIVGWGRNVGRTTEAFVWTEDQGMQPLPGTYDGGGTIARAVSADGSVIVGNADILRGIPQAVRWSGGTIQILGAILDYSGSTAQAVSGDGSVIGGIVTSSSHLPQQVFVWTEPTGMLLLSDYLALHGVIVPDGWWLEDLSAISGDGLTFAGQARDLSNNHLVGFVATVPAPGSLGVLFMSGVLCVRRRRGVR